MLAHLQARFAKSKFRLTAWRSSCAGHHRLALLQRCIVSAIVLSMLSRVVHPNYSFKATVQMWPRKLDRLARSP